MELDFNSLEWKSKIERLIEGIYASFQKQSYAEAVKFFPERIELIFSTYQTQLNGLKDQMGNQTDRIDRHKIAALYVQAILAAKVFYYYKDASNQKGLTLGGKLPNEFAAWVLLNTIIEAWNETDKKIPEYNLRFPDFILSNASGKRTSYQDHFVSLIYGFKDRPLELPVFTLAHIIFYLEMVTNCCFYNSIEHYFSQETIQKHSY